MNTDTLGALVYVGTKGTQWLSRVARPIVETKEAGQMDFRYRGFALIERGQSAPNENLWTRTTLALGPDGRFIFMEQLMNQETGEFMAVRAEITAPVTSADWPTEWTKGAKGHVGLDLIIENFNAVDVFQGCQRLAEAAGERLAKQRLAHATALLGLGEECAKAVAKMGGAF